MANAATAEEIEVKPFQFKASDADLADLRKRIAATRWPDKETVNDLKQGVPLALLQDLAKYWAKDYDWRKVEARINAFPNFTAEIDGLDIHFIHVKSKHADALPIIITHGWPGSIIEQSKIIEPLTNPTAHGGTAADAFHVVIPSLPGYGFSAKPTSPGWGPERTAKAWIELMKGLGYTKFVAQGGDWGSMITDLMGVEAPPELIGIHNSMPAAVPDAIQGAAFAGAPAPAGLSADEKHAYGQLVTLYTTGLGYAIEMTTRPQTLTGIADSPIGLAAWLIDHGDGDSQPAASIIAACRKAKGKPEELTRDDVLDNITFYWLTKTEISSSRFYWENKKPFLSIKGVKIPTAVTAFPSELYTAPKSWAEKAYPKLIYFNKPEKGGHFAAWEQPELFASEMRNAFKSLRKS
jgi:pimeloyl-ACP methyl ester carboxylesterase